MNDAQLLRYARHLLLEEFGTEAQERLLQSHVLIIGVGGLGCAAAMYLASSGVGTLTLCDGDTVDLTNLQRQIAHTTHTVGQLKTHSAKTTLAALNPEIQIRTLDQRADPVLLDAWVPRVDLVLDCSDNFTTRYVINQACVTHAKPLISAAAERFEGQISTFDLRTSTSPCYACLFPQNLTPPAQKETAVAGADLQTPPPLPVPDCTPCATLGVFAPLVGVIGTMQATEALRMLTHIGRPLSGRLLRFNALDMVWNTLHFQRQAECAVCGQKI